MEAFGHPAGRYVEPLEGWTVVTCDRSSAGQGPCGHSVPVGASRRDRSTRSSPFTAGTHLGRARRHFPRDCQWLLDARHRSTPEPRLLHSKSRGGPPWRTSAVSRQPSRSAGVGLGPKTQDLPSGHSHHAPGHCCVASKLIEDWSPEQISGWLKQQDDETLRVSHETIYRSLFIQARGALKQELIQHLR